MDRDPKQLSHEADMLLLKAGFNRWAVDITKVSKPEVRKQKAFERSVWRQPMSGRSKAHKS